MRLPPNSPTVPSRGDRLAALAMTYVPWAIAYATCGVIGAGARPINIMLPLEGSWPVWEWTLVFYLWEYPWAALAPLVVTTHAALRQFVRTGLVGTAFITGCFLIFPFVAIPRPLDPTSLWAGLLGMVRAQDTVACAFPSFHVFWAFVAAEAWWARLGGCVSGVIAVLIAASCVTISAHSVVDVIAGWLVYLGASRVDRIWSGLRRVGPARAAAEKN